MLKGLWLDNVGVSVGVRTGEKATLLLINVIKCQIFSLFYKVHCTFLLGAPMHVTTVMPPITSGETIILFTFLQYIVINLNRVNK